MKNRGKEEDERAKRDENMIKTGQLTDKEASRGWLKALAVGAANISKYGSREMAGQQGRERGRRREARTAAWQCDSRAWLIETGECPSLLRDPVPCCTEGHNLILSHGPSRVPGRQITRKKR